jgi:hypothetical protein
MVATAQMRWGNGNPSVWLGGVKLSLTPEMRRISDLSRFA